MSTYPKAWIAGVAGIVLMVVLVVVLAPEVRNSWAAARAQKLAAPLAVRNHLTIQPMKIVPADVLATSVHWAPLTGDGSN